MSVVEKMVVQVAADYMPLAQGLAGATAEVKKTSDRIGGILDGLNKGFAALGVGLSVGALANFTKGAMNSAEALVDTAQSIGITTASLQELRYAAVESGLEVSQIDSAITKFSSKLGDAVNGTGDLAGTMARLGISVKDSHGAVREIDDLLAEFAQKIGDAGSAQEKLAIATDAFGKDAAPGMVRVLTDGADGLAAMRKEANELGLVMSDELLRSTKETNEEFDRFVYTLNIRMKSATVNAVGSFSLIRSELDFLGEKLSGVLSVIGTVGREYARYTYGADALSKAQAVEPTQQGPYVVPYQPGPYVEPIRASGDTSYPTVIKPTAEQAKMISEAQRKLNEVMAEAERLTRSVMTDEETRAANIADWTEKLNAGLISQETYNRLMRESKGHITGVVKVMGEAAKQTKTLGDTVQQVGQDMADALGSAVLNADSLTGALGGVLQRLAQIGMQDAFGSIFSYLDFGSLFGGGGKAKIGARASGGPVIGGMPYLIGERGPELFVPSGNGSVVSNGDLRSAGAGGGGGVSVSIAIDARGADAGAEQRLRAAAAEIKDQTFNAVFAAMGRGGGYAKMAGRR